MDERAGVLAAQKRRAALLRTGGLAVGFVALVLVVNALAHGDFLEPRNLTNVLRQITVNAILAVGQTFVIITAGIDLSVGSILGLCGVVMAIVANALHLGGPGTFVVTLLAGLAVGCAAGWINALPVVRLNLPPFITTLAMMQVARGLAFILAHGQPIPLANSAPFDWLGTGYILAGIPGFPGHSVGRARDGGRVRRVRDAARPYRVRPLRDRARRQRGGGAARRHRHAHREDARVRDLRRAAPRSAGCC